MFRRVCNYKFYNCNYKYFTKFDDFSQNIIEYSLKC